MSELSSVARTYIFIDYENIQPKTLPSLNDENINILVFAGKTQDKIGFNIAKSLQLIGKRARYIKINAIGNNALDFHIVYYIGLLSGVDKTARFHVISKDTGFDPLIAHLKTTGVQCTRSASFPGYHEPEDITEKLPEDKIIAHLEKIRKNRPSTEEKLRNMISAVFKNDIPIQNVTPLIEILKEKKIIQIDKNRKIPYLS
ncbi:PIN domain-containing protein [Acetobacter sp.]|jgi:hypothetical protein|uniref:PIN domain-containing protein n=1 Tax=Acetobacter sp. TaxID=440 RepID=UPI0025BB3192|nr:PIN domain-containing protein [Acetobacter sp.]MCH4089858.1 PIN domain-containing protein [Acetobacter sp.]MCI1298554.1 PIN domain-containing protein [Acetobacter sp.]MCI1315119.1 PIN domain-containing protein [Acetobacter sp.]